MRHLLDEMQVGNQTDTTYSGAHILERMLKTVLENTPGTTEVKESKDLIHSFMMR